MNVKFCLFQCIRTSIQIREDSQKKTDKDFFFIFEDFRPISGAFPAFHLSRIFSFPTDTLILFFPEHFKWLTGTIPQFIAVLQKHKLDLVLKMIDESLG